MNAYLQRQNIKGLRRILNESYLLTLNSLTSTYISEKSLPQRCSTCGCDICKNIKNAS